MYNEIIDTVKATLAVTQEVDTSGLGYYNLIIDEKINRLCNQ